MRKGDQKRQDLLNAAEKLFCSRGYDATSVQDILNVLHASKGGFYHHFASKEELLKTLTERRCERAAAFTAESLERAGENAMQRINAVLHGFMPLRREETPFVTMLLPLIEKPEGRAVAMIYQDALSERFLPLLQQEMARAAAAGVICPPVRDMETPVLHLVNRLWMDVAGALTRLVREGQRYDTSVLLAALEKYRRAVEVLLDAPYGSVEIIRIEEWEEVAQRLIRALEA